MLHKFSILPNNLNSDFLPKFEMRKVSKVCVFCYKPVKVKIVIKNGQDEASLIDKFLTFLKRFVDEKSLDLLPPSGESGEITGCCADCKIITYSFCESYHQLKCAELRVEKEVVSLLDRMQFANRVPSRIRGAIRVFQKTGQCNQSQQRFQVLSSFRRDLEQKCSRRLRKSYPKVLLSRYHVTKQEIPPADSKPDISFAHQNTTTSPEILPVAGIPHSNLSLTHSQLFGGVPDEGMDFENKLNSMKSESQVEDVDMSSDLEASSFPEYGAPDEIEVHKYEILPMQETPPELNIFSRSTTQSEKLSSSRKPVFQRKYHCSICNTSHKSYAQLLRHKSISNAHNLRRIRVLVKEGGKNSGSKSESKRPIGAHTTFTGSSEQKEKSSNPKRIKNPMKEERTQKCDECPATFVREQRLIWHKLKIHFQCRCPVCQKSYPHQKSLRAHLGNLHPTFQVLPNRCLFPCDIPPCRKVFATAAALEKHKTAIHTAESEALQREHECPKCGKTFKKSHGLRIHMSVCEKSGKFSVCQECGKIFKKKFRLEQHMLTHVGPDGWTFECETCKKRFATKHKLKQHHRSHTKEKPFVCQFCGEKYAHNYSLRKHVTRVHSEEKIS